MSKVRFSISLDEAHALRIRAAAAQVGMDVSAYMSSAALEAVERDERAREVFADIDERIADAEAVGSLPWPPAASDGDLDSEQVAEIAADWKAFFGAGQSAGEDHKGVA
ncbi:hypothetical protein [Streptomyces sp. SID3343]|uniref:hypothetical protein n=1 Tax=Streptomyces sp. SID3343 TaxID=2690260 RepID=UPI00136D7E66|nr:hypothetical protein [Streptomyces sp. SID3343]MYV98034.1 hypothetical protein [Streptomyces sp. SID3343]